MRSVLLVAALAACSDQPHDVVGPFTGAPHHFVVDSITLPASHADAISAGDNLSDHGLNGDAAVDNDFGEITATAAGMGILTTHGRDMIGGGAIASSVDILADDLVNDSKVGVLFFGTPSASATPCGGTFVDGTFTSNRTLTTRVPGEATVVLPVFTQADPMQMELDAMEIDLASDGSGGFDAAVRGGFMSDDALAAASTSLAQAMAADAQLAQHLAQELQLATTPATAGELEQNSVMQALFAPDVDIRGVSLVSAGFHVHLAPCDSAPCPLPSPIDRCFDRVQDQDETGVDCGGTICVARCP